MTTLLAIVACLFIPALIWWWLARKAQAHKARWAGPFGNDEVVP